LQYFYKKSIGIAIANSFLTEYLYWYWQYFMKVLLTTLAKTKVKINNQLLLELLFYTSVGVPDVGDKN